MKIKNFIPLDAYEFTFGQYKGKTAKWVYDKDPNYLVWCHRYVAWFELTEEDYKSCKKIFMLKLLYG